MEKNKNVKLTKHEDLTYINQSSYKPELNHWVTIIMKALPVVASVVTQGHCLEMEFGICCQQMLTAGPE